MIRQARALLAVLLVLAAGATAVRAQERPSFDCAKADNNIDRAICKNGELAKADREMAAAYTALLARLSGASKDELVKDQVGWIANRNRGSHTDPDNIEDCLKNRYAARIKNLRAYARAPILQSASSHSPAGKLGKITWSYDLTYPRFDGANVDFAAVNARFADAAKKITDKSTPKAADGPEREQQWYYQQRFTVERPPGGQAATIVVQFDSYRGGAHGYGATRCTLVNLRTGKVVAPQGVFTPGEQWLRVMSQLVGADLKKQFVDKPGFDDALEPANLAKLLSEANRYCWTGKQLEVIFNAYDVGPYAAGPYEVNISYDRLKQVLRPDGPIARWPIAPLSAPFLSRWPARRWHKAHRAWIAPRQQRLSSARSAPSPSLAAADRKMAAAYAALAGKLTGAAKDHLLADQIRWLANRSAACVADPAEMEECLKSRDRDRTAQLEWLGEGAYPFISEQAIVKTGKVRGIPYIVDASYPQFDTGTADFSAGKSPAIIGRQRGGSPGNCRSGRRQ